MSPDEALRLCRLAKALSPAQAVDEYTPDAWSVVLKDVRYVDAETALGQLGSEQEWIHVSHIVRRVKKIRNERVGRHIASLSPPSGMTDAEYAEWQRREIKRLGDSYEPTPTEPAAVTHTRDVIRELGQAKSIDSAIAIRDAREAHAEAKRELQAAEAERIAERDAKQARLEAMRAAERERRANQTAAPTREASKVETVTPAGDEEAS